MSDLAVVEVGWIGAGSFRTRQDFSKFRGSVISYCFKIIHLFEAAIRPPAPI